MLHNLMQLVNHHRHQRIQIVIHDALQRPDSLLLPAGCESYPTLGCLALDEPPRVYRRPFGLGQAAKAWTSA